MNLQPKLKSDNVELRPLEPGDFERLYQVASDPLIWEQHPNNDRYQRPVFENYFNGAMESKGAFLILGAMGETIGCTRFYNVKPDSVAIGYTFISRKHWGTSTNAEVKKLLLDHAFQYVDKVYFHVGSNNIRSQKAVQKLGAVKVAQKQLGEGEETVLHFEYELKKICAREDSNL